MRDDDDELRTPHLPLAAPSVIYNREQDPSNNNHCELVEIDSVLFSELLVNVVCIFYVMNCSQSEVRLLFLAGILIKLRLLDPTNLDQVLFRFGKLFL